METHQLLTIFLEHWPESYHKYDQMRFVRWAIAAHREEIPFPLSQFESHMDTRAVQYYQAAFDMVGYTLEALDE